MATGERVTDATRQAEARDAEAPHGTRSGPDAGARRGGTADPRTKKAYDAYLDAAADQRGEGRIP